MKATHVAAVPDGVAKLEPVALPMAVEFAEGFFRYQSKDLDLSLREMAKLVIDLYLLRTDTQ